MNTFNRTLRFASFVLLIGTVLSIASCTKNNDDDKDNGTKNGFTYKGSFYITEMLGVHPTGGNNVQMQLSGADTWVSELNHLEGNNFSRIRLEIHSFVNDDLAAGSYTFSSTQTNTGTFGSLGDLDFIHTCNFVADDYVCNETHRVNGGTVTITRNGSNYVIDYSITLNNGETVTGHFEGSRDYYY